MAVRNGLISRMKPVFDPCPTKQDFEEYGINAPADRRVAPAQCCGVGLPDIATPCSFSTCDVAFPTRTFARETYFQMRFVIRPTNASSAATSSSSPTPSPPDIADAPIASLELHLGASQCMSSPPLFVTGAEKGVAVATRLRPFVAQVQFMPFGVFDVTLRLHRPNSAFTAHLAAAGGLPSKRGIARYVPALLVSLLDARAMANFNAGLPFDDWPTQRALVLPAHVGNMRIPMNHLSDPPPVGASLYVVALPVLLRGVPEDLGNSHGRVAELLASLKPSMYEPLMDPPTTAPHHLLPPKATATGAAVAALEEPPALELEYDLQFFAKNIRFNTKHAPHLPSRTVTSDFSIAPDPARDGGLNSWRSKLFEIISLCVLIVLYLR